MVEEEQHQHMDADTRRETNILNGTQIREAHLKKEHELRTRLTKGYTTRNKFTETPNTVHIDTPLVSPQL